MKQKGFTLIELLVTMGIIAVLTGMAAFNFNQSRERARDVQRKSDLGQLIKALELYKNDNNSFPLIAGNRVPDDTVFQQKLIDGGYIKKAFNDPKGSTWQNYRYINATEGDSMNYFLMACLENNADSTRATGSQCQTLFDNYQGSSRSCECGDAYSGAMYIVSNP